MALANPTIRKFSQLGGQASLDQLPAEAKKGATMLTVAPVGAPAVLKARADYVCDGTADNVQIQAAIDALAGVQGGEVQLMPGEFGIADTITLRSGITLVGAGEQVGGRLLGVAGLNKNMIEIASGAGFFPSIRNILIEMNHSDTVGHGIYQPSGSACDLHLTRVFVQWAAEHGLYALSPWGSKITDCTFEYCGKDGINLDGSGEVSISGAMVFGNNRLGGVAGIYTLTDEMQLVNCYIGGNKRRGLWIAGKRVHIANCSILDNSDGAASTYSGIYLTSTATNVQIVACFIGSSRSSGGPKQQHGIYNNGARELLVSACTIMGNRQHGILLAGIDATIVGNLIAHNSTQTANTYDGINATSAALRATIVGNRFDGASLADVAGQEKCGLNSAADNTTVRCNVFTNHGTAPTNLTGAGNHVDSFSELSGTAARNQLADASALDTLTGAGDADSLHTHAAKLNAASLLTARTTAQFDKTNATLADVPGLSVPLAAGKTYLFQAYLFLASLDGGARVAVAGTSGLTATAIRYDARLEAMTLDDSMLIPAERFTALGGATSWEDADAAIAIVTGCITVNAAGNLTVQFAQGTTHGSASSVLVGSHLIANEVG